MVLPGSFIEPGCHPGEGILYGHSSAGCRHLRLCRVRAANPDPRMQPIGRMTSHSVGCRAPGPGSLMHEGEGFGKGGATLFDGVLQPRFSTTTARPTPQNRPATGPRMAMSI